jgi:hypothetical protein
MRFAMTPVSIYSAPIICMIGPKGINHFSARPGRSCHGHKTKTQDTTKTMWRVSWRTLATAGRPRYLASSHPPLPPLSPSPPSSQKSPSRSPASAPRVDVVTPTEIRAVNWRAIPVRSPHSGKLVPQVVFDTPPQIQTPSVPNDGWSWRSILMTLGLCGLTAVQLGAILTWSNDASRLIGSDMDEWELHKGIHCYSLTCVFVLKPSSFDVLTLVCVWM